MWVHVCSFDAVGPIKRGTSYEDFKERVLDAGRFSTFEACDNERAAALYTRLMRDPEIEKVDMPFPWTGVRRRDAAAQPEAEQ